MYLKQRSIDIILENQHGSGAYIACPNFPTYQYCWFRDGSFVAYSMDLTGQFESAHKFHAWAALAVNQRLALIDRALQFLAAGKPLGLTEILHTRYTLDGEDGVQEEWPNFQLDGFGTWLWALNEHRLAAKITLPADWIQAATATATYLEALWGKPCYDCWEEFPDKIHLHTLAAIYGGLHACQSLDGIDRTATLDAIKTYVMENGIVNGHISKYVGSDTVDASLLGLCLPYQMLPAGHELMKATAAEIEKLLNRSGETNRLHGGVHRYVTDTYYGGGAWILLSAWLGWYFVEVGETAKAFELLAWIESCANETGDFPEQVPQALNDPAYYQPWVDRWGPIATPLLWSHANYLILRNKLNP